MRFSWAANPFKTKRKRKSLDDRKYESDVLIAARSERPHESPPEHKGCNDSQGT